jgi:hypothetical protein
LGAMIMLAAEPKDKSPDGLIVTPAVGIIVMKPSDESVVPPEPEAIVVDDVLVALPTVMLDPAACVRLMFPLDSAVFRFVNSMVLLSMPEALNIETIFQAPFA